MTIAAGILCREGVLLCSDTEHTGQYKTQDTKIGSIQFPAGSIAYAIAGHEDNAWAAIDKLGRELAVAHPGESVRSLIDRVVDRQYRKNVLPHNDPSQSLDYQLLLAYRGNQNTRTDLYVTRRCAVRPVRKFSCIGYGGDFGSHLLKSRLRYAATDNDIWSIAAYMLAVVKKTVPYCGGESILLMLRNDGLVGSSSSDFPDSPLGQIGAFSQTYDEHVQRLFLSLVDPFTADQAFSDAADELRNALLEKRKEWYREREWWIRDFTVQNPSFNHEGALHAYMWWTMGLPPTKEAPVNPGGG